LQIEVIISTAHCSWHYVINMCAVCPALLACVSVTLKYALPDLAPLAGAAIVFECAHQ
jgi:amino acid permease